PMTLVANSAGASETRVSLSLRVLSYPDSDSATPDRNSPTVSRLRPTSGGILGDNRDVASPPGPPSDRSRSDRTPRGPAPGREPAPDRPLGTVITTRRDGRRRTHHQGDPEAVPLGVLARVFRGVVSHLARREERLLT